MGMGKRLKTYGGLGLLVGVLMTGCDDAPSANRHEDTCAEPRSLRVEVMSSDGAYIQGASVTATNLESNISITGVTDDRGVTTAINETLAPSPIRVVATAGSHVTHAERVEWTCDECHCTPVPDTVTLKLQD
ncbi:carboxypeptidase regulatory-like domain-containing protein [Corallococcus sp. AB030]|uniref:Carboxypeptidase regulatory-like domain-containing protein n=3 Tax=Myxococcaceae TaxID=31 RepID=A0A7X5BTB8_9BACT|nr:carboxypeptidase regulatory-like domain-containing protein [Corallococcus exiguus]RKI11528.1 carboxypeptidase regulatory-like domain-containing protein [Corallococcus sp. AB030]TNV66565.1 carboxypeptidase regulatory-like domain-containing protein [Corallococcus exiguus]